MKLKRRGFPGGFNRFRLMLTLGLAVVLPAAALIYVNFSQLRAFERDKVLEAAIHRDFQEMLAITEKKINKKAYAMSEDVRNLFPSPDTEAQEKEKQLGLILEKNPWLSHVFLFDEKSFLFRSQPQQMGDIRRAPLRFALAPGYLMLRLQRFTCQNNTARCES